MREALIQLGHDNVLKSIPRCGYQVIQIQAKDIRDLTEVRLYLELGCLQKMVESPDEATLSRLKELNRLRCVKPVEQKDVWSAWDNNVQFHLCLLEGADNTYALDLLERTLSTWAPALMRSCITIIGRASFPPHLPPMRTSASSPPSKRMTSTARRRCFGGYSADADRPAFPHAQRNLLSRAPPCFFVKRPSPVRFLPPRSERVRTKCGWAACSPNRR